MIADRHPFVVGQQRIVGPEQFSDGDRMIDSGIEIRVVPHGRRQVHHHLIDGPQHAGDNGSRGGVVAQQRVHPPPQRASRPGAHPEESVEGRPGGSLGSLQRRAPQQSGAGQRAQIQDSVADPDSTPWAGTRRNVIVRRLEDAEGQVLQREIGVAVGALDPAADRRVVGLVDLRERVYRQAHTRSVLTAGSSPWRATNRKRSPRNTERVHSTGRPSASRPVRCTSRIGSPVSTPSRSTPRPDRPGPFRRRPRRRRAAIPKASSQGPVERTAERQLVGQIRQRSGEVGDLVGDRLVRRGAQPLHPMDRCSGCDLEVGADLVVRGLLVDPQHHAARSPTLGLQIPRERRELPDLHELGLRDERAATLGAFQPAVDHQFGDGLADRRA